ncbi:hypothetical protein ACP70R_043424 [Stipagrostis hirtigluma subsp. patula]
MAVDDPAQITETELGNKAAKRYTFFAHCCKRRSPAPSSRTPEVEILAGIIPDLIPEVIPLQNRCIS